MNKKHNRFHASMSKEQVDLLQGTEIKSKRTRFGKVFSLGANRFQAVTYTDPVHHFNANTHEWEEVDNRFSRTSHMREAKAAWKQGIMPAVAPGDILLECKTGSIDVACAMSGEVPFINLTDAKGRKLAWGIEGAMSILPDTNDIIDVPAENVRSMRDKVLDHLHGEVTYNGIFAGVDLRCKLDRGFKDELIFVEKEAVRPITFLLESEGREMELNEQNMLIVKNEKEEVVFRLLAPFMLDANETRGDVAVKLEDRKNGMYAMTYIPDANFINKAAFPVALDPEVQTEQNGTSIVDTYIREGYTTNFSSDTRFWVTATNYYGKRYGLLRVEELPPISSNHFITGAYLYLKSYNAPTADAPLFCSEVLTPWEPATVTYADMFPTDGTSHINPLYQDYCTFPASKYTWQSLDVTSLARKWYMGENNGVMFTPNTTNPITIQIQSSDGSAKPYFVVNYASLAGLENYLTYDQQSAGHAGAGSVSLVNGNLIFSHADTSMNGNRLPVSITHFYNSCDSDRNEFGLGNGWRTNYHQTVHKEFLNNEVMYVYTDGDGTEHWFEQDAESDSTQYVDMSGLSLTLTIGENEDITITDKSDSRMVFPAITSTPSATAPITEKVLLKNIYDAVGNMITVTARSDNELFIDTIRDGAGRDTTFVYVFQDDGALKWTAIKTPWQSDTTCTRFEYNADGNLFCITHEDGRLSQYEYAICSTSDDPASVPVNLLTTARAQSTTGEDIMTIDYQYSNVAEDEAGNNTVIYGLPYCVTRAVIKGIEGTETLTGSDVTYSYHKHMTLVTDNLSHPDPTKRKALRYHFNDNGNQISIDDGLGYALYTKYDQSGENENAPINHATTRSRMQRVVKNLLLDHMMDADSSVWEKSTTGTFTRDQANAQWGPVSYKIWVPTNNGAYMRQAVAVTPGKPYTFSAYMRSGAPTVFLRISYTINGETKYFTSDALPVSEDAANAEFKRLALSFTLPETADSSIYCEAIGMLPSGYFWIDCMQLEEGLTCNHFNMLQNNDFTHMTAGSTIPTGWTLGEGDSSYISIKDLSVADDIDGKLAPEFLQGYKAARLAGQYNRTITLNQEFRCSGKAGDRFTAGGWCKSFAKKMDEGGYIVCSLAIYFSGGYTWFLGGHVTFNYGEDGWQFASGSIVAPDDYAKIRFSLYMNRQMNHADFTGLYLYPESFGTDYVYDAKGNRKKAIHMYRYNRTQRADGYQYDECDNLITRTAPGRAYPSTFFYGDTVEEQKKHLLLESHSPMGTNGHWGYDTYGNAVRSDISGSVGNQPAIIRSTTDYQHNGNYIFKQKDARGMEVTTEIDQNKGITTCVTAPNEHSVNYTYDTLRRIEKVITNDNDKVFRNEYSYDPDRGLLTSVKHNVDNNTDNDVIYSFEYDKLGRKTSVKIGKVPSENDTTDNRVILSTNVYQDNPVFNHYGTLAQMQYGNGTVVQNEYDDFNRVTGIVYGFKDEDDTVLLETKPRYAYSYNANGQVAHVRNNLINQITESEYDLSNRPCRIKTHKFTEDYAGNLTNQEHVYTGEVAYNDEFGILSEFREAVGSNYAEYVTSFGYDDENRPTALGYGDYGASTVEYDGLGRVAKTTVKAGSGTVNTTEYTYVTGAAWETTSPDANDTERTAAAANAAGKTSTTGLIKKIAQTGGTFEYSYDENGNITKVRQDGVETTYTYDALGQLIRVVDGQEGATWEYSYDQGGNILTKKKYVEGELADSMILDYVHEGASLDEEQERENEWRDLLKYVNNQRITYDKIGNPLNDGTWQYAWQNGRQLRSMSKSGTFAKFVYNENGLRVKKIIQPSEDDTANAVETNYTLHGKNVVHMTTGNDNLHFFYDAQNKPAVVVFNGTPYSYVKNLQGDIVAILDSTGTAVVQYKYDAWGRPISKTGSLANTLGTVQPFRYRGYVYDEETGLYYLCSRYHNPTWCRFINADILPKGNAFAYCMDNPVVYADYDGYACVCCFDDNGFDTPFTVLATGIGGGGGANGIVYTSYANANKEKIKKELTDIANASWKLAMLLYDELVGIYSIGDLFESVATEGAVSAGLYFTTKCTILAGPAGFIFGLTISAIGVGTIAGLASDAATQIDGKPRDEEHMLESMTIETTAYAIGYAGMKETAEKKATYILKKTWEALIR